MLVAHALGGTADESPESQKTGARASRASARSVRTSGTACTVCPVRVSRSRRVSATKRAPAGRPSTSSATSRAKRRQTESSWARTVKVGAIPERSDG